MGPFSSFFISTIIFEHQLINHSFIHLTPTNVTPTPRPALAVWRVFINFIQENTVLFSFVKCEVHKQLPRWVRRWSIGTGGFYFFPFFFLLAHNQPTADCTQDQPPIVKLRLTLKEISMFVYLQPWSHTRRDSTLQVSQQGSYHAHPDLKRIPRQPMTDRAHPLISGVTFLAGTGMASICSTQSVLA